jgi:protein-L-isoaspartate O-methyltransferase
VTSTVSPFDHSEGGSHVPDSESMVAYLKSYARLGNHVARYQFAKQWILGGQVLEIGCGHGAGAALLAPNYSLYVGVDADVSAVAWAKRNVEPAFPHSVFLAEHEFQSSYRNAKFDSVIAFEVLEHVYNPRELIGKLAAATKPGGLVVLSTPNGVSSLHQRSLFRTPLHVDEYDINEVVDLLSGTGQGHEYFMERRIDWIDVWWLRRRLRNARNKGSEGPRRTLALARLIGLFAKYLNGTKFWVCIPTNPARMNALDFSTIVARFVVAEHDVGG